MSSKVSSRQDQKQVAAWLPKPFVEKFKRFVKSKNAGGNGIRKMTEREVIYEALSEKMDRDGVKSGTG